MKDELKLILISVIIFVVFFLYGYYSEGTHQDDDVTHFLIAKISWKYPESFLSIWGRPSYTIAYSLPSQLGFAGARFFTSLLASLTCFLSGIIAKKENIEKFYMTPFFVAMQPIYFVLSYAFLTEIIFGFILILGILLLKRDHYLLSSIVISFIPLARHEGMIFLIIWFLILLRKDKIFYLIMLFPPMIIWNLMSYFYTNVFPVEIFFNPGEAASILGRKSFTHYTFLHYVVLFPFSTGLIILFLFEIGFIKSLFKNISNIDILHIVFIVYFTVHTLLYIKGYGSGGDLRLLACISPICGIFSLIGYNYFFEKKQRILDILLLSIILVTFIVIIYGLQNFYKPLITTKIDFISQGYAMFAHLSVNMSIFLISITSIILYYLTILKYFQEENYKCIKYLRMFLVSLFIFLISTYVYIIAEPYKINSEELTMKEVAYWLKKEKITERNILFSPHSWLFYFLNNGYEAKVLLYFEQFKKYHEKILSYENIVSSEPGTILIWNRKYGGSIINYIEREENFRLIKTFFTANENNTPFVYVYEKLQPSMTIR